MTDDIDRLKNMLEDFHNLRDGLQDGLEAIRDVVAAVKPVELETDPEGHGALRDIAADIRRAHIDAFHIENEIHAVVTELCEKARA